MKSQVLFRTFATALFLGVAVGTISGALAQEPRITGNIETQPTDTLTAEEMRHVSEAGARILTHVDRARQALTENAYDVAQHQIDQARTLAQVIKNAMPTYVVRASFASGDARYTDEDEVKPLVVPIYEELVRRNVMAPIRAAMRDEAADSNAPIPTDIDLVHTRAELNVALADAGLTKAEAALHSGNYDAADLALRTIQTGVVFTYTESDLPLELARENLITARNFVAQGDLGAAEAAINVASDALERYAMTTGGTNRSEEVNALRDDLSELTGEIESGAEDDVIASLEEAWERVAAWYEETDT